ncbi:hypothetical protein BH18THE2_BH18THE2_20180 [soil metagenome]
MAVVNSISIILQKLELSCNAYILSCTLEVLTHGTWHINLHNHNHHSYNNYYSGTQVSVSVVFHCPYRY